MWLSCTSGLELTLISRPSTIRLVRSRRSLPLPGISYIKVPNFGRIPLAGLVAIAELVVLFIGLKDYVFLLSLPGFTRHMIGDMWHHGIFAFAVEATFVTKEYSGI